MDPLKKNSKAISTAAIVEPNIPDDIVEGTSFAFVVVVDYFFVLLDNQRPSWPNFSPKQSQIKCSQSFFWAIGDG